MVEKNPTKLATKPKAKTTMTTKKVASVDQVVPAAKAPVKPNVAPQPNTSTQSVVNNDVGVVFQQPQVKKFSTKEIEKCIAEFRVIPLVSLDKTIESALLFGQYIIICDKSEQAAVYFTYKATLREFHKEVVKCRMGDQSKEDTLETLRKGLIYSMRAGDTLVINMEKLIVDFKDEFTSEEIFPAKSVFNFEQWREYDNYFKIVRDDEKFDYEGNQGRYEMRDKFMIAILCPYTNDEELLRLVDSIPNGDEFTKIIIAGEEEAKQFMKG